MAIEPIVVEPFEVPGHCRRIFGVAIERDRIAAVWIAIDDERDVAYSNSELCLVGAVPPAVFVQGVKARGAWPGVLVVGGSAQAEAEVLLRTSRDLGLKLAVLHSPEAGMRELLVRLSSGRLKVFRTCARLLEEFRGAPGPTMAAAACAVSGLATAALRPRDQWSREMIGIKPTVRHKTQYEPLRELYAGSETPLRSDTSRRR
jgi:hypothetical protein